MGAQFSFWSFFLDSDTCQIFPCLKKKLSRPNFMLSAWLEEISHYQHSSYIFW
eukprot:UN25070